MTATLEEVRPVALTPAERKKRRADMAAARERRFQRRKILLEADPHISPRRRELYLDRTLVNVTKSADLLGLESPHRLNVADDFLDFDAYTQSGKCVELGRLREWAEKARHYTMDPDTGALIKGRNRHGAARKNKTQLG